MEIGHQTPGVYPEKEVILQSAPQLQTGVPGFVGFIAANSKFAGRLSEPVPLNRPSEFEALFGNQPGQHLPADGFLAAAVNGFFLNGGARCYVVCAALSVADDAGSKNEQALKKALQALAPLTDLDLIAAPDVMMLEVEAVKRVQLEMLQHCKVQGNRFAILDALPGNVNEVVQQRNQITRGLREPVNGALYYPWLVLPEQAKPHSLKNDRNRMIPPSGHIAGIFARSDARVGVFKAPANEEVIGALDLCVGGPYDWGALNINNQVQDQLNPQGINCLRAFPGRGIRVWGARALNGDPDWRYVNVCRLVVTLRRWIEMNMTWASFEPNTPELWVRIHRELTVYLTDLWRAGALAGRTADEAFYVECDSETNPPQGIETGQVVTDIGLAPGAPAEFVIVRVVHQIGVEPR
jgi:phage tail sheath protein FI